ncbi:hypothetical protein P872_11680 [Rhodonellum psychrophilum GCM71 = DSM 17998]|uniref:Uncharacterized protein n=2 Tax=Rhodonellum TaxID=336827 RepID=U5BT13_9BACT|nr:MULTISPECIES: hypothetical protein [Rhodonellum]ERM81038.1 hypothetical protein P872_11680 [Rhodonellum psychrophilum GCM71 = DSM 17998]SDZ38936.1 hypothetical protein SAMN05444412_11279 [Rhodonellum ikkaensis]
MSVTRLLYIDDNRIDSQIENLRKKLKRSGFDLDETFLNLNDENFKKRNENQKVILDLKKIKEYIIENYSQENFDIVASDYDYSDENVDGYQLLSWIKNQSKSQKYRLRFAQFCLYSAEQDKIVEKLNSPDQIKKLVKLKIDDFIDRNNLAEDLFSLFIKPKEKYSYSKHLIDYLEKYPDLTFNSVYPKFKGKSLSEIAHEIDKDLPNGIDFQKNLVELTIAHLVDLNKFEY